MTTHDARWRGPLLAIVSTVVLLFAFDANADIANVAYSHANGDFTLSMYTSQGLLANWGNATDAGITSFAQLQGSTQLISMTVGYASEEENLLNVVAVFPYGNIYYQVGDFPDGSRGRLISTSIPAGSCANLATDPTLTAVIEAFRNLQQNRAVWSNRADAPDWERIADNLVFFFLGTDFDPDCQKLARPQDEYGCDRPFTGSTCGQWGACCDAHDECYARWACTEASWGCFATWYRIGQITCAVGGGENCRMCNMAVVDCFMGSPTGPSKCCGSAEHPCGSPR